MRLMIVPDRSEKAPVEDVNATWEVCAPGTVANVSAVGYYFAQDIVKPGSLVSVTAGAAETPPESP